MHMAFKAQSRNILGGTIPQYITIREGFSIMVKNTSSLVGWDSILFRL
jgi:hypothetical protein